MSDDSHSNDLKHGFNASVPQNEFQISISTAMNNLGTSDSATSNSAKINKMSSQYKMIQEPGSSEDLKAFMSDKNKKKFNSDNEAKAAIEKAVGHLRGSQIGGGRVSAKKAKENDDKMLLVAELFYQKKDLMLKGNLRTPEHRLQVTRHWRLITDRLYANGYEEEDVIDIQKKFQTFRNNALNKQRGMDRTGAATVKISEASLFFQIKILNFFE
uniref:Uncharacterized protein n=1 Tax=Panagrolaimus davidi TaxID=227884 RepID=A0A914P499_9BILA